MKYLHVCFRDRNAIYEKFGVQDDFVIAANIDWSTGYLSYRDQVTGYQLLISLHDVLSMSLEAPGSADA